MSKKPTSSKPSSSSTPKFGSPEWQVKYGKGAAKANAQKKLGAKS